MQIENSLYETSIESNVPCQLIVETLLVEVWESILYFVGLSFTIA